MENTSMRINQRLLPFLLVLIGAFLMTATLFMPYAAATQDHAERLNNHANEIIYEELDMTGKDIVNISMVEYAKVYSYLGDQLWGDASYGTPYVVMVALIGGFALLALLFAVLKKPIAIIIFDILAFGVFSVQNWDYTDRGVIPSSSYDWGLAYYLFYVAAIITLVGSVWMLVNKIRVKTMRKAEDNNL